MRIVMTTKLEKVLPLDYMAVSQSTRGRSVSAVDWHRFAAPFASPEYVEEVVADAINRLGNGDVSMTRYGIRVQVRPDLGDFHPTQAAAFWPKDFYSQFPRCACNDMRDYGVCSHVLAARIYRAWLSF